MVKSLLIGIGMVLMLFIAGCSQNASIANPASEYCMEQGGTLDIREDVNDGQYGVCILENGIECDEWAYFRGECPAPENVISSFDDCIAAGNPVMESYPRQCSVDGKTFTEVLPLKDSCENVYGGVWLDEAMECEGVSEIACSEMDGSFNGCASACRHIESDFCTMQCVFVCSFENVDDNEYEDNMQNNESDDEQRICTMEYAPVCGVDGITYSNRCMAGDVEIDYFGECFSETAKADCESRGGRYEQAGMMQMYLCNMPTSDAGDSCEDSSECEGLCWDNGTCSEWAENFGCFDVLENGEKAGICID